MNPKPTAVSPRSLALAVLGAGLLVAGCAGRSATSESSGTAGVGGTETTAGAPASPETPASKENTMAAPGTMPVKPDVEPQHIKVQHILIGFAGTIPGKPITRTKEEARVLAYQILERARKGEDFDALVRQYTDDSPPGIYGMSNFNVTPGPGEYPRDRMVPAFGNVGFAMSAGNIGIADYDPETSPYGWHIIKRLE
ncbi:MAG: peptidylprolyl isomerase [Hyphomicrobiales bacterium]